ncbi:MAG: DUF885 family protein [Acidimicrobiia bacterium]|nr:DUF885 family protein [Acidimicrobiia bacterium]
MADATSDSSRQLAALAAEYWEVTMRHSPTYATLLGDHRYDDQIEDLSEDGDQAQHDALGSLRDRLARVDHGALLGIDAVTARLLASDLADRMRSIELSLIELRSDQMDGPHVGYLISAPQMAADDAEQAHMLTDRFRHLGTALDQAIERFRAGAAKGRAPAQLCIARSLSSIDGYLASPLDDDVFVNLTGPEGWPGEAAWRDDLRQAVRTSGASRLPAHA